MKKYRKASDKWWNIAQGKEADKGWMNCPLCLVYIDDDCYGCPVAKDTGEGGCRNTPHKIWLKHQTVVHMACVSTDDLFVVCPECQRLALNEWLYLKSIGE